MVNPRLKIWPMALLGLTLACASKPERPEVFDPRVQPMTRTDVKNFQSCFNDVDWPYEAFVEVELETTFDGYVRNPRIRRSTNACFNEPVLDAVSTWRYPPKVVDGELAARRGVKAVFAFTYGESE